MGKLLYAKLCDEKCRVMYSGSEEHIFNKYRIEIPDLGSCTFSYEKILNEWCEEVEIDGNVCKVYCEETLNAFASDIAKKIWSIEEASLPYVENDYYWGVALYCSGDLDSSYVPHEYMDIINLFCEKGLIMHLNVQLDDNIHEIAELYFDIATDKWHDLQGEIRLLCVDSYNEWLSKQNEDEELNE